MQSLIKTISKQNPNLSFFSRYHHSHPLPSQLRSISSTPHLSSWLDSVKGVFKKDKSSDSAEAFTLGRFADELRKSRSVGSYKQFMVGRSSNAAFSEAFEKWESIIRYLNRFDPSGENLQVSQKQEAAKQCNCTIADVENALAKFTWAKEVEKKLQKLKDEGKPLPKTMAEMQKMIGTTHLDIARSNLAKSGQTSRNAPCPCGSKKRYKWCCAKNDEMKSA